MGAKALPLHGRRIVLTRATEQAGPLAQALTGLGAEVILLPTVQFRAPQNPLALDAAIARLAEFDWVIFTSQNAVSFFVQRCHEQGKVRPAGIKVAAVGPATAAAAADAGWPADHVAARFSGEALADELSKLVGGKRILLPRSDRASQALPEALSAAGARVEPVVAYVNERATVSPAQIHDALSGADAVCFASPSAWHHLLDLGGDRMVRAALADVAIAAIGPATAAAIRSAGLSVSVEASEATAEGLARALDAYFNRTANRKVAR